MASSLSSFGSAGEADVVAACETIRQQMLLLASRFSFGATRFPPSSLKATLLARMLASYFLTESSLKLDPSFLCLQQLIYDFGAG